MRNRSNVSGPWRLRRFWTCLALLASSSGLGARVCGQSASTGALIGIVVDPSGAVLPSAVVHLIRDGAGETRSTTSDEGGRFGFPLLPPGTYNVQAERTDFELLNVLDVHISVAETLRVELGKASQRRSR